MRALVVYKTSSDHARAVTEFLREFNRQTGRSIEEVDPDSVHGESFCKAYDIVAYPTVIALDDESRMLQMWPGQPLPTIMEVSYYA